MFSKSGLNYYDQHLTVSVYLACSLNAYALFCGLEQGRDKCGNKILEKMTHV